MKATRFKQTILGAIAICTGIGFATPAHAAPNYYVGKAVEGQRVYVDLGSITRSGSFGYSLGNQRVDAIANCRTGSWTTLPERAVHRPQSQATQTMLNLVCNISAQKKAGMVGTGFVFAPPSNVRSSPNGSILCSVSARTRVNLYGSTGSWYYTDACGPVGFIHRSQLEF